MVAEPPFFGIQMRTFKEKMELVNWFECLKVKKDCPFAITVLDTKEHGTDIHLVVGNWVCPKPVTIKQVINLANILDYVLGLP